MIHGSILTADELLAATGYERVGDLTRALTRQGIPWFPGKGGKPWTTIDLINKAGGLTTPAANDAEPYDPDSV